MESGARFPAGVFEMTVSVGNGEPWTVLSAEDTVGRRMPLLGMELRCLGVMVLECFELGGRFSFPAAEALRR